MRTKNLLSGICAASLAALSLVGCSDYDNGYTEKSIIYDKQFADRFGQIDPNQDWNLVRQLAKASRGRETRATTSETVFSGTYGKEGDIQITVERTDEDDCILWTYEDVMAYDDQLPEKKVAGKKYYRPEGELSEEEEQEYTNLGKVTQDFMLKGKEFVIYPLYWNTSNTNTIGIYYYVPDGTTGDNIKIIDTKTGLETTPEESTGQYKTIQLVDICQGNKSAELQGAIDAWDYFDNNTDYDTKLDIKYKNGLIRNYPDRYKYEEGSTSLLRKVDDEYKKINDCKEDVFSDLHSIYPDIFAISDGTFEYVGYRGTLIYQGCPSINVMSYFDMNTDAYEDAKYAFDNSQATHLRSWGIKVTVPTNITFGFYISNGSGFRFSETALNERVEFPDTPGEKMEVAYAVTYDGYDGEGEKCRYLCFEDWINDTNFDLNDVVFRVVGIFNDDVIDEDKPKDDTKKEEEVTTVISEGLLVCEDLGDYDFDFNDVVLKLQQKQTKKVTTVNGVKQSEEILSNTLDVTAMAAGGTLTSYIYYKYNKDSEGEAISDDNEIHRLLGGSAPSIINAGPQFGREGQTIPLKIGEDIEEWDETDYSDDNGGYVTQVFKQGLIYILVEDPDTGEKTTITPITSSQDGYNNHASPQMMLLPVDFLWPQEQQTIDEVYSRFSEWVGDTNKTGWYTEYDDKRVTKRSTGQ